MSSTLNSVRAAIEGQIATELAKAPTYPASYQNVPFTPPSNGSWVQVGLRFGDSAYHTLLPSSSSGWNRQNGTLSLTVYTPQGVGHGPNLALAARLRGLFDRARLPGIRFDAASGPNPVGSSTPGGYYATLTTVTFEAFLD